MVGVAHRSRTRIRFFLTRAVILGTFLIGPAAMAVPVTLTVRVQSPQSTITELDEVILLAGTIAEIDPGGGWLTVTNSLVVDGFDIDWEFSSAQGPGIGADVMTPLVKLESIGSLPAGTYNVTANWLGHVPLHPGPLTATTQFTVIPEPASLAVMSVTAMGLLGVRRRR